MKNKFLFLLLTTLVTAAHAGTITLDSSAFNTVNNTGLPTLDINPHPAWAAAFSGSQWISIANTGNPSSTGYVVLPNGTSIDFSQTFNLDSAATGATLSVLADDTTSVSLNGHLVYGAASPAAGYPTCSAAPIGCLTTTEKTFTFAELSPFLQVGANTIDFDVFQKNGASFGLDYAGSVSTTPEPASLALIGVGLIGLALVRKLRRVPKN